MSALRIHRSLLTRLGGGVGGFGGGRVGGGGGYSGGGGRCGKFIQLPLPFRLFVLISHVGYGGGQHYSGGGQSYGGGGRSGGYDQQQGGGGGGQGGW